MRYIAIFLTVTCIVLDQSKSGKLWLTTCEGIEENGQVLFNERIPRGKAVGYKPFVAGDDDIIHGLILNIEDPQPKAARPTVSSDTGKVP